MELQVAFILLFTHGLPILFFTYMATDVFLRNQKKTEHILISLISICYLLLFTEEYVRIQVPIEYSPMLSSQWLSSVGILIPGLGFHFLIKFTRLDASMPRYIYPYIFYLPAVFVLYNFMTGSELISAQQFTESGIWKPPVYNTGYYIAMIASIINNALYLIPVVIAKSKPHTLEQRSIYNLLSIGIIASIIWHSIFGLINFGEYLPPYPYLYCGLIWCYFLRYAMKKHDFLNLYDKRFEKLFYMNPNAILLIDSRKTIKNANPNAEQLFSSLQLDFTQFYELIDAKTKSLMQINRELKNNEISIVVNDQSFAFLLDAAYVLVDNEPHVLLILRDITLQKQQQDEIQFLAYHDALTRLPNRRFFLEKLDEALLECAREDETLAVLLIDLDNIKLVNDTYGHFAGDETIVAAARTIQDAAGQHGVAARLGGDEFIMFIRRSPTREQIEHNIELMQRTFAEHVSQYHGVGLSVGVSFYPQDGTDARELISVADQAMYEMKRIRKIQRIN